MLPGRGVVALLLAQQARDSDAGTTKDIPFYLYAARIKTVDP